MIIRLDDGIANFERMQNSMYSTPPSVTESNQQSVEEPSSEAADQEFA
jgi:hypothetical protein